MRARKYSGAAAGRPGIPWIRVAAAVLLTVGLATGNVQAATMVLVHESDTSQQRVGEIDNSAALTLTGTGQNNCCQMSGALATVIPGQDQIAMIGGDVGTVPSRLLIFDTNTGTVLNDFAMPSGLRAVALAADLTNGRVVALAGTPGAFDLGLYTVNTATGVWALQNTLAVDCCTVLAGVEAVNDFSARWYVAARFNGDSDWRLLDIDLTSDTLAAQPVLSAAPVALASHQGILYGLYHDSGTTTTFPASINPATGVLTNIGAGRVNCCETAAGVAAVVDDSLRFIGRDIGAAVQSYWAVDLTTGGFSALGNLAATDIVNALLTTNVPVIAQGQTVAVNLSEDSTPTPFQLELQASDPDGGGLTWAISSAAGNGMASISTGSGLTQDINYLPASDYFGGDSFQVTVQDVSGDTDQVTVNVTVAAVNDAPSFIVGPNQSNLDNQGAITLPGWATSISPGPANEAGQSVGFVITGNTAPDLFSVPPSVAANGTLSYTVARGAGGTAMITLLAADDGGTANGGVNISSTQSFMIEVQAVTPVIQQGDSVVVNMSEDGIPTPFALMLNGTDPLGGGLTWTISSPPAQGSASVSPGTGTDQTVQFIPAGDVNGAEQFTVQVMNSFGETDTITVDVSIAAVNDAPAFTSSGDVDVGFNPGAQTVAGWASAISAGPPDEAGQSLNFEVVALSNPAMFAVPPSVDASGTLSFEPVSGVREQSDVSLRLRDDGGTAGGGSDVSATTTFRISVGLAGTTDLSITISNGVIFVDQGEAVQYQIVVRNTGFEDALGAAVENLLPAGLASTGWTCAASGGATCSASGNGDISDVVDLPSGSELTYTHGTTVVAMDGDEIDNPAQVIVPAALTDLSSANNSDVDSDTVGLLKDSFEDLQP